MTQQQCEEQRKGIRQLKSELDEERKKSQNAIAVKLELHKQLQQAEAQVQELRIKLADEKQKADDADDKKKIARNKLKSLKLESKERCKNLKQELRDATRVTQEKGGRVGESTSHVAGC